MKTKSLFFVTVVFLTSCVHKKNQSENSIRNPASLSAATAQLMNTPVRYAACNSRNSYLEPELALLPEEYKKIRYTEPQKQLPVQCLQIAQRSYAGHYARCESEEAKPQISVIRPCLSETYVSVTYNAYHDVMDCFNLDAREMYYQIMIESGFHINAINRTGFDSGMAQFTANGIKHVAANNLIERTRRMLLESSRPSCQRISSIVGAFNIDAFTVQKRCSMIALPKNPYRAMLFGYLHTMLDQIKLDELLSGIPQIYDALTPQVRRQFLYFSYNRGMTGLMRLLRGYVQSREELGQKITEDALNLSHNLSQVKEILKLEPRKREILKNSKVRNLSFAEYAVIHNATYLSDMSAARDYVERYYGNSCGEF